MPQPVHLCLDEGFLHDLADSLGRAIADNGGGVLVYVVVRPDGPDVGILPLDGLAPADVLLGADAPAEWEVLGVAMAGMADVVVLVSRDGQVVGQVRQGDLVSREPPAQGVTLDCLRRALGLPAGLPGG